MSHLSRTEYKGVYQNVHIRDFVDYQHYVDKTKPPPLDLKTNPPDRTFEKWPQEVLFEAVSNPADGNSKSSFKQWNDFQHYKRSTGFFDTSLKTPYFTHYWTPGLHGADQPDPYFGWWTSNGTGLGRFQPWDGQTLSYDPTAPNGRFVKDPSNLAELQERSLKAMLPGLKQELSLVNSLIELKDIVTLKRSIQSLRSVGPKLLRAAKAPRATFRELTRISAGSFLQWKFNLQPLWSDIRGVYTAIRDHERRVNDLISRSGKVQKRHFTCVFDEGPRELVINSIKNLSSGGTIILLPYPGISVLRRTFVREPTRFHAQIEYQYSFTKYQLEHAKELALLDALGVSFNPAIIWNAIPFSFMLDWIVDVSQFLDNFKVRNMEPRVCIRRYLWSVKRRRICHSRIHMSHNISSSIKWPNPAGIRTMPVSIEETYSRQVGIPARNLLHASGLNSNELILGSALVLAQRRRPKKSKQ
jgi:hypothetical protein